MNTLASLNLYNCHVLCKKERRWHDVIIKSPKKSNMCSKIKTWDKHKTKINVTQPRKLKLRNTDPIKNCSKHQSRTILIGLELWLLCLTPLSKVFQSYRGGQFYWWRLPPICRKSLTNFTPRYERISTHKFSGDRHWLHMAIVDPWPTIIRSLPRPSREF